MQLQDIFAKSIDRPIEGVIKADDLAQLKLEVEEYVFTNEISKRLSAFLSAYNDYQGANGAWISGFFGSGKSHLLKMLAFLLENRPVDGKRALDYFIPKCGDDAMLQAEMRKAASIPSTSILFNIDQKADTITRTETDAVLRVFVKVFDEMCGYYGKQGYVAQFERDMDGRGWLAPFKQAYQEMAHKTWERGREQIILEKQNIARAYARVSGEPIEKSQDILDHYRADYKVSIEDFAELVNAYIQKQAPNFRLNFLVDEVGQFVGDNVRLMTNLQTIAESLATRCRGRAWLIVTAQEDMETVLGEVDPRKANDFTKIQDRFKTRLKLTSANVDEVIQKRLLKKNSLGESELEGIYRQHKNNFGTLFEFSDGSQTYRGFRSEEHFVNSYPFIPYQFSLFHTCIQNLSKHSAFEGRHTSVGERSMLGVFQHVVQAVARQKIGELATFDLMFEGIRTALMTQLQSSIQTAEQNLESELAIRLLKALFLVKYVKGFKATPHNLRILMQSKFDQDILDLEGKISEALAILDLQTYIQRNGEVYEYLTDEEKDVEQEIKNTDVETGDLYKVLEDIFFTDVVRERKIRYDVTGQDFAFAKKLDDRLVGREQELSIHLITPLHENADKIEILQANSLGRPELLVVLPPDSRLVSDLYLLKKTEAYIRQNSSTALPDTVRRILSEKSMQNSDRTGQIKLRLRELVGKARLFAMGSEVDLNGEEPRGRVLRGFGELIVRTYPNLRMLNGVTFSENEIARYLQLAQNTPLGTLEFTEAEKEMFGFINMNQQNGIRTTVKSLEDKFTRKPYGWDLAAVQCLLAKLCGRGKVEARASGNLLEADSLERALRNTHGFPNVILDPQPEIPPDQIRWLKNFYSDFFDTPPAASEARTLGKETAEAFRHALKEIEGLYEQYERYPFLSALGEPLAILRDTLGKPYTYYFLELAQHAERLLDLKENHLDPIRRFMSGPNKAIYDEAAHFVQQHQANFDVLGSDDARQLQEILADPACYRGSRMREAKALTDQLQAELQARLDAERMQATSAVKALQDQMHHMSDFSDTDRGQQQELDKYFALNERVLNRQILIPVIRDARRRFEQETFPQVLTQMSQWAQQARSNNEPEKPIKKPVEYVSSQSLKVDFDAAYLATEQDVADYLERLKAAMLEAIRSGKRIQI
ncbi:MAG: BREX system P-loop protein BrxC [Anaerolineales bacterium]|jgi:hypothetical protein|nr:BREX system P-loop protein BrxC [Anaerolineales bacterium]